MLLALGAVYVTLNIDAEEFSEMNRQGMRLLRWKGFDSRGSPEKGYGVEGRLEGPCTSVLRPSDGLTLAIVHRGTLYARVRAAKRSGGIRQRGKYIKRPSDDRAKNVNSRGRGKSVVLRRNPPKVNWRIMNHGVNSSLQVRRRGCADLTGMAELGISIVVVEEHP